MPTLVLIGLVAVLVWSLVSHRVERWGIAGPLGLLVLGALAVLGDTADFADAIDSPITEKIVEIVLAILLFTDAIEVKGGLFGGQGRATLRLVLIALPLALILAVICGIWLIPDVDPFTLIVLACVVMPTDFAPAARILRARFVPERLRQILNVESGYNDGLVSPLFGMALPLAVLVSQLSRADGAELGDDQIEHHVDEVLQAFSGAIPAMAIAVGVGVAAGLVVGALVRVCRRHGIASAAGARVVMLLLPLAAYGVATLPVLQANGFVAAFVAGIAYRMARTRGEPEHTIAHDELSLVGEVGEVAVNFVWFVLGAVAVLVVMIGVDLRWVVFALLALTLVRMVPVYVSLFGSRVAPRERLLIGAVGPRGTASIVFGLLAYNALPASGDMPGPEEITVLAVMVITVVGSILLHGVGAPLVLSRLRGDAPGDATSPRPESRAPRHAAPAPGGGD